MKPLAYVVNVLGLTQFVLEDGRRLRKFRPSTHLSVYSVSYHSNFAAC